MLAVEVEVAVVLVADVQRHSVSLSLGNSNLELSLSNETLRSASLVEQMFSERSLYESSNLIKRFLFLFVSYLFNLSNVIYRVYIFSTCVQMSN